MSDCEDNELDPRIQIELEKLNTTTDEINKLEIEYDEANNAFRTLLNESTKRLKLLSKKLGSCIERARPYFASLEVARKAQQDCQKAAVQYQRASEIHAAAKETVALAEHRFMTNQHEWQFDNAWQEMLNHATIKVMEAEHQKAESGREHQRRAAIFKAAENELKQLEDQLGRNVSKARPYFDQKAHLEQQLSAQKTLIESIRANIVKTKTFYAQTLKELERISNEIHLKRGDMPTGPREPGVGAEITAQHEELPDIRTELDKCALRSYASCNHLDDCPSKSHSLDDLRVQFKEVAVRPVDGGEGKSSDPQWESELNAIANKLDHEMFMKETCDQA